MIISSTLGKKIENDLIWYKGYYQVYCIKTK